ncbi:DUF4917 family protein [Mesorhizobium ciceri]|uniref:DUF4917 family protein n=1 Tax=Mesorhizobium ciceri TaxID=39645 RepID=UPI000AA15C16|nr:DUF4917 family protein [Mesorhizobium ciceri]
MNVLSFADAMERTTRLPHKHLILGNGFSISLKPDIFTYGSLLDSADFGAAPHVKDLFGAIGTQDFELVIKNILDAATVLEVYDPKNEALIKTLKADANVVKEALVTAIAKRHPDRPYDIDNDQYKSCREFLSKFKHIYTLNYDVLLYWTLMNSDVDRIDLKSDDGFRHPDREEIYVTWQEGQSATIHFLHGALHLFDAGAEILKYTWSKTDIPIVEQIRQALSEDKFPLFVAEGDSESKLRKIMHSAYLHKGLRSLESSADNSRASFVMFGHSLADNDMHVLKCIGRGKTPLVLVSVYGDPESHANKAVEANASWLVRYRGEVNSRYPLEIVFYDAATAHVWG